MAYIAICFSVYKEQYVLCYSSSLVWITVKSKDLGHRAFLFTSLSWLLLHSISFIQVIIEKKQGNRSKTSLQGQQSFITERLYSLCNARFNSVLAHRCDSRTHKSMGFRIVVCSKPFNTITRWWQSEQVLLPWWAAYTDKTNETLVRNIVLYSSS